MEQLQDRAGGAASSPVPRPGAARLRLGAPTQARAGLAASLGRREEAIALIQRALAEGMDLTTVHADAAFEPLINDPRFRSLLRPKP